MKEILQKILEDFKQLFIYIINKFFLKLEDKLDDIPDDLGAKFKGPMEADPRDFKVENILWAPTEEELKNLPEKVDLLKKAAPNLIPIYQGCVPSCTESSLGNYITLQEVIERQAKLMYPVKINWIKWVKINREKMWHKWTCNWEYGDYLENALKVTKKNKLLATIEYVDKKLQKDEYLWIDGYAYANTTIMNMKYWLSKWYPLYFAFRGNRNTRVEMSKWEVKTYKFTPTGWHAVTAYWYDKDYLYFINTWRPNDWNKYEWDYSIFKIKWTWLMDMLKYWLANWRFWIVYNTDDNLDSYKNQMFKDYRIDKNTEQWQAVKKLAEDGIIKWVPHSDGKYLEPNRSVTRLELAVILYRFYKKYIAKK